jgi:hypothetical protein
VALLLRDLAGDVGEDRAVAVEMARLVAQPRHRLEIRDQLDTAFGASRIGGGVAKKEVEKGVGTDFGRGCAGRPPV